MTRRRREQKSLHKYEYIKFSYVYVLSWLVINNTYLLFPGLQIHTTVCDLVIVITWNS